MLPVLGKLEEIKSFFLKLIPFGFAECNKSTRNVLTESAQPESNH